MSNVFEELNKLNVNDHTEIKKTGGTELTYLSWTWAWAEVKKRYPEAHYEIEMFDGLPYVYDENTGYMVFTNVTIEGITHSMWLPVLDGANKAMKAKDYTYYVKNQLFKYATYDKAKEYYTDKYGNRQDEYITKEVSAASMFDVNKTIMRCLVKNLAMFGLGLYIYAGEDLPEPYVDSIENLKKENTEKETSDIPNGEPEISLEKLKKELKRNNISSDLVCSLYGRKSLEEMSENQIKHAFEKMELIKQKQEEQKA